MYCVLMFVCVPAAERHSGSMGIFSQIRFCYVAKALCIGTKAHSVGDNEMKRECCPLWTGMCPLAQVTMLEFRLGPHKKMPF